MPRLTLFWRQVATVALGASVAQALPVLASPIVTRLFSPDEFGQFAVYMSVLSVVLVVATLRLELALLPSRQDQLGHIVLGIMASGTGTLLLVTGITFFAPWIWSSLNLPLEWRIAFLFSLLIGTAIAVMQTLLAREERFNVVSQARALDSSVSTGLKIGFGIAGFGSFGLLVAQLGAQLLSAMLLASRAWRSVLFAIRTKSPEGAVATYRHSSRFVLFTFPSSLLEFVAASIPVLAIGYLFGAAEAGLFALAHRVLRLPVAVIASSTGEVMRTWAAKLSRETGDLRHAYISVLLALAALGSVPATVLAIWGRPLFEVVFGESWALAGTVAALMAPLFLLQFVANPLGQILLVTNRQHQDLAIQVFLVIGTLCAFYFGYLVGAGFLTCIAGYVVVYCVKYLLEIIAAYGASVRKVS